jgi:DNA-directed RNA polymerase subunit RPC12/RpoP
MGFFDFLRRGPKCSTCGSRLKITVTSRNNISMYAGVICTRCGRIECNSCKTKKGVLQAPCSLCGSPVTGVMM